MNIISDFATKTTQVYYPAAKAAIASGFSHTFAWIKATSFANPLATIVLANVGLTVLAERVGTLVYKLLLAPKDPAVESEGRRFAAVVLTWAAAAGAINYFLLAGLALPLTAVTIGAMVGGTALGLTVILINSKISKKLANRTSAATVADPASPPKNLNDMQMRFIENYNNLSDDMRANLVAGITPDDLRRLYELSAKTLVEQENTASLRSVDSEIAALTFELKKLEAKVERVEAAKNAIVKQIDDLSKTADCNVKTKKSHDLNAELELADKALAQAHEAANNQFQVIDAKKVEQTRLKVALGIQKA